eukprot:3937203-Rhodomonas_salina.1
MHERDLCVVLIVVQGAASGLGRRDDLVRAGVEEGDEVVVDVLLAVRREGAVLSARGVDDAGAGGEQVEEADEELARVCQVAVRVERPANLVQLRVGDGDPGALDLSVRALALTLTRRRKWFHRDGVGEDVTGGAHELGALLSNHIHVCINEHVGAVHGVALVVGSHQVELVGKVTKELGEEVALAHVLKAAHGLGKAGGKIIARCPGHVGAAREVFGLEGAVVGTSSASTLGHEEGAQAVDLNARRNFVLNHDLPGVDRRVEGHGLNVERGSAVQEHVALALEN